MDYEESNRYIGYFQNLVIVVSAYEPVVTCYGSIGAPRTVDQALIDVIPTTYDQRLFAPAGVPGAGVIVPKTYDTPGPMGLLKKFYAKFETMQGRTVTGRWFDLWAATVAINVLCVRHGRAGKAWLYGGLVAKVDRSYVEPGGIASETSNDSSVVDDALS